MYIWRGAFVLELSDMVSHPDLLGLAEVERIEFYSFVGNCL